MNRETKIGLLAIATLVIVFVGYRFLKGNELFSTRNTYFVTYANVDQLGVGDRVTLLGKTVGQVTVVDLNPNNVRELVVGMTVDETLPIPKDAKALIRSDGILGGKFIALEFVAPCSGEGCAEDGDYLLPDEETALAAFLGDPEELVPYFDAVRANVGPIVDSIASRTDSNSLGRTLANLELTTENLAVVTERINLLLRRTSDDLARTTHNISGITANLDDNNARITSILRNVDSTTAGLAGLDLAMTVAEVNTSLQQLRQTLASTDGAMANVNAITAGINRGEGSLGKLIKDDDIAVRLERTLTNTDLLMQDLRLNPKRYVNVSVFGKKQREYDLPEDDPAEPLLDEAEADQ